jgi:hypothetical protein
MESSRARVSTLVSTSVVLGSLVALVTLACGSTSDSQFPGSSGSSGDGSSGSSGSSGFGSSGSSGASGTSGGPCVGLQCKQVACPGGGTTSLSGVVYDPTGTVPLYNAIVYVPNAPLVPFKDGVTCDQCGTAPSGSPITTAITDSKGKFTLKNVPVGVDFPLVVQIGRWRRQVQIPGATQCADTALGPATTRLPRNQAEGSIPKIAITTGGADSLECFLRKLGVDDSEFTNPDGMGRIHLYAGVGGSKAGPTPDSATLWDDAAKLKGYDITILSCEGDEHNGGLNGVSVKGAPARANLKDYLDAGGRVFASHFHYTWLKNGAGPLPSTATWVNNGDVGSQQMSVNTSFAKGQAFSEWLVEAKASTTPGIVPGTNLKRNVTSVPGAGAAMDTSRAWLSVGGDTKFYSFNAPVGIDPTKQCGRGVYTDIHVSSGGGNDSSGGNFPNNCKSPKPALSPQEKALLFLLMDLSSCIQDDSKPPEAPPAVVK